MYCTPSQIIWLLWYELLELKQYLFGIVFYEKWETTTFMNKQNVFYYIVFSAIMRKLHENY